MDNKLIYIKLLKERNAHRDKGRFSDCVTVFDIRHLTGDEASIAIDDPVTSSIEIDPSIAGRVM